MKKTIQTIIFTMVLLFASGCAPREETRESIGSVKMKENGTLVFVLSEKSEDGLTRRLSYFEVKKEEDKYQKYLSHVSPIKVGKSKPVRPWEN